MFGFSSKAQPEPEDVEVPDMRELKAAWAQAVAAAEAFNDAMEKVRRLRIDYTFDPYSRGNKAHIVLSEPRFTMRVQINGTG